MVSPVCAKLLLSVCVCGTASYVLRKACSWLLMKSRLGRGMGLLAGRSRFSGSGKPFACFLPVHPTSHPLGTRPNPIGVPLCLSLLLLPHTACGPGLGPGDAAFNCPKAFQQNLNSLFACYSALGPCSDRNTWTIAQFWLPALWVVVASSCALRVTGVEIREGEACRVDGASASNP